LTRYPLVCSVLHMPNDSRSYESGDITVTTTFTGNDSYTREITIGGERAFINYNQRLAYPGDPDGHTQAALASITALRSILDTDVRRHHTNAGTTGDLQDRFATRSGDLWQMWCDLNDAPLVKVREAAVAYQAAESAASAALVHRDEMIREAAQAPRVVRTRLANAADISRERLYQILGHPDR
jgi:hypothetical protein